MEDATEDTDTVLYFYNFVFSENLPRGSLLVAVSVYLWICVCVSHLGCKVGYWNVSRLMRNIFSPISRLMDSEYHSDADLAKPRGCSI